MDQRFSFGLLACVLAAMGCGPVSLTDRFAGYQSAIEQASGAEGARARLQTVGLPRKRDRRLPLEDQRIRILDFLALQGCSLGVRVGERNSPLGRVMRPVARLGYEVEILRVANACLQDLSGEQAARIHASLAVKRAELATHRFHAVWNEAPMERYLGTAPTPVLGRADGDDLVGLIAIRRVLESGIRAPETVAILDQSLERLRDENPLGGTLRILDRAAEALDRVADLVQTDPARSDGCDPAAAGLVRIFRERYLPLQAPLGVADRNASAALPELDRIYQLTRSDLAAPLPAMDRYHQSVLDPSVEDGLWRRYRSAVRRHSAVWTPTLERCGAHPAETRL